MQALIGKKLGQQLHAYANGIDQTPVLSKPGEAKGYSNSTTLARDVRSEEEANRILLALADSVASRIRADGVRAYCVSVTIRANDFKDKSHQQTLLEPTDITDEIFRVSKRLFAQLWDGQTPLRLLGISLTQLTRDEYVQQSLFPDEKKEREKKLDQAVDHIRGKFGSDTICRGAILRSDLQVGKKYKSQLDDKKK